MLIATNLFFGGTAVPIGDNALVADPQFVDFDLNPNADFHLRATSPAINNGLDTRAPAFDFDGKPRSRGSIDIGPFER